MRRVGVEDWLPVRQIDALVLACRAGHRRYRYSLLFRLAAIHSTTLEIVGKDYVARALFCGCRWAAIASCKTKVTICNTVHLATELHPSGACSSHCTATP